MGAKIQEEYVGRVLHAWAAFAEDVLANPEHDSIVVGGGGVVRHGARSQRGAGHGAMALDFGQVMVPWMYVDASAAIGIAQRKGLGRIRHLHTQSLWEQDAAREKRVFLDKVPGLTTPPTCIPNILMPRHD